jgi:hypothetical protein
MKRHPNPGQPGADPAAIGVVTGLLLAVLTAATLPAPDAAARAVEMLEVDAAHAVRLAVPPGTPEVRLLVIGAAEPEAPIDEPELAEAAITWLDAHDAVLRTEPVRWMAAPSESRPGWLDPRSLAVAPPEGARAMEVRGAAGRMQLRAWGASPEARDPTVASLRIEASDADILRQRLGLRPGELSSDELRAMLRVRDVPLRALDRVDAPVVGQLARVDGARRSAASRRADGLTLDAGRAVAWNHAAAVVGRLELDGEVELVAVLEDVGAVAPEVVDVGGALQVALPGPGSLWVRATTAPVRLRWRLDAPDPDHEALPAADDPDGPWIVLPPRSETVVQAAEPTTPWRLALPEGMPAHALRLSLRPLVGPAELRIVVESDDGEVAHGLQLDPGPGGFELSRPDGARGAWTAAADPERWWLAVPAGATAVRIESDAAVAVDAAAPGPEVGALDAVDALRRTKWRHHAAVRSTFRSLGGVGAPWRVRTNPRREPIGGDAWSVAVRAQPEPGGVRLTLPPARALPVPGPVTVDWRTVPPLTRDGAAPGERFLLPSADGLAAWCPLDAGAPSDLRWRADHGGVLAVRVVAPGAPSLPDAGAAWSLAADGHAIAGGTLATAVAPWSGRPSPFDQLALSGPVGLRAWVRVGDTRCPGGRVERRATPAHAASVRWRVAVGPEGTRVSLGGLTNHAGHAQIRVHGEAAPAALWQSRTPRELDVALTPTPRAGLLADQPWRTADQIEPVTLRLGADVGGWAVIEARADVDAWLWLAEPGEDAPAALPAVRVRG